MSSFRIEGRKKLQGRIRISGSKNSCLALMAGAALGREDVVLTKVPVNTDVQIMAALLQEIGVEVEEKTPGIMVINGAKLKSTLIPHELARKLRASFYLSGLFLSRLGKAEVPLPGGCFLGPRPVDFHIKGFEALGARVAIEHGLMKASLPRATGSRIFINRRSMGTTINLIFLAVLAEGTTVLENAAKTGNCGPGCPFEFHGRQDQGAGTEIIRIQGVPELHGAEHSIIPDRIEAGTYMMALAAAGGDVVLENVMVEHLRAPLMKLREAGLEVEEGETDLRLVASGACRRLMLKPHPIPVSHGSPATVWRLMTMAEGTSIIRETIYDNRFRYLDELTRMGANIKVDRDRAIIKGVPELSGAPVETPDLRAGAALVVAGLGATGVTVVANAECIDRGYENMVEKLREVGACIYRQDA